jgi:hypothetical protein
VLIHYIPGAFLGALQVHPRIFRVLLKSIPRIFQVHPSTIRVHPRIFQVHPGIFQKKQCAFVVLWCICLHFFGCFLACRDAKGGIFNFSAVIVYLGAQKSG